MSRWIEVDVKNKYIKETIASMNECRHLCNQVCCNDLSDQMAEFVDSEHCKNCPLFEKEDGIIHV